MWSCQNATFTIKGIVIDPDFEGANVYLQERTDDDFVTLETTNVQNGTFTFTGMADENALRLISLGDANVRNRNRTSLLLERGTINVTFDDVIMVSGTRINTAFNEHQRKERELARKTQVIIDRYFEMRDAGTLTDELAAEIAAERAQIEEKLQNVIITFIRNNIENAVGRFMLERAIHKFQPKTQAELLALTDDAFRAKPTIAPFINRNVAIGNRFVDFTLQDPKGNEISLSDFAGRGNYVLVNFWATWCAPCVQKIPHLAELYAKYKSRGFEIVGVSFDNNHDSWIAGIERLNITWAQMWDARERGGFPLVWVLYALRGIPHTVLLDREGIIIANSLEGEALDRELAKLMP